MCARDSTLTCKSQEKQSKPMRADVESRDKCAKLKISETFSLVTVSGFHCSQSKLACHIKHTSERIPSLRTSSARGSSAASRRRYTQDWGWYLVFDMTRTAHGLREQHCKLN
jgi:hypothetical protein